MGCGCRRQEAHLVETKKQSKTLLTLLNQSYTNYDISINIFNYLSLVDLGRITTVCKTFYRITGDTRLLSLFYQKKQSLSKPVQQGYTYTNNNASKEYDFLSIQGCKTESHFPFIQANDPIRNSILTPKFVSHPPTINDAIKKEMKAIENEYNLKKSKDFNMPGYVFSVTDSLENPNAYVGIEETIKRKNTERIKSLKNCVLSGA